MINAQVHEPTDSMLEYGTNTERGNLLGIQPFMEVGDYATTQAFITKVGSYLKAASQRDWLTPKTIVALPEHLGTWLVAVDEHQSIFEAETVQQAMTKLVIHHPVGFVKAWLRSRAEDRVKAALFRMEAAKMAAAYHTAFSKLAHEYRVTLVAGSIVLPTPEIIDGELVSGDGPLQNISVVYRPDGRPYQKIVRKAFPTEEELPFTAPAPMDELPVFGTPAVRLGVLICADSWRPGAYEKLKAQQPDVVVVPSYLSTTGIWDQPWLGYNGASAPKDAHPADVGRLTEGEAWLKYALPGRMATSGARHGINVFLRGKLWDLGADGRSLLVNNNELTQGPHGEKAVLINCWL